MPAASNCSGVSTVTRRPTWPPATSPRRPRSPPPPSIASATPLYSARPGYVEEAAWRTRLGIRTREVNLHYWRYEEPHFDPWNLLPSVSCPVQIIAGEDDPICPVELVQNLASRLPGSELVRLTGARHTVFRDQPEAARDAVIRFIRKHAATDQPNARDDA